MNPLNLLAFDGYSFAIGCSPLGAKNTTICFPLTLEEVQATYADRGSTSAQENGPSRGRKRRICANDSALGAPKLLDCETSGVLPRRHVR
jgi:hypothetical protein